MITSRFLRRLTHPVSIVGLVIVGVGFAASLIALVGELGDEEASAYQGLLTFVLYPSVAGLGLAVLGRAVRAVALHCVVLLLHGVLLLQIVKWLLPVVVVVACVRMEALRLGVDVPESAPRWARAELTPGTDIAELPPLFTRVESLDDGDG